MPPRSASVSCGRTRISRARCYGAVETRAPRRPNGGNHRDRLAVTPKRTTAMSAPDSPPQWHPAKRFLFRFIFAYLFLYNPLALLNPVPEPEKIFGSNTDPYTELWHPVVIWVGRQVFQVEITVLPAGSGDTTFNYVQVFCFLVLAAA